jgi:NAD(P)-dependent dehydrogenase (short-subunit alcohol dehydrogenase family)
MRLDPANKVADQIRRLGAHATAVKCDITDEKQVIKMAAQVSEDFGRLNLLCNVAGVNVIAKLHETSAQDVEWLFAINVFGACHMARHKEGGKRHDNVDSHLKPLQRQQRR